MQQHVNKLRPVSLWMAAARILKHAIEKCKEFVKKSSVEAWPYFNRPWASHTFFFKFPRLSTLRICIYTAVIKKEKRHNLETCFNVVHKILSAVYRI